MFYCNSYTAVLAPVDNLWVTSIINVSANLYEPAKGKGRPLFQPITQWLCCIAYMLFLKVLSLFFRFNLKLVGSTWANLTRLKSIFADMTSSAAHKKIFFYYWKDRSCRFATWLAHILRSEGFSNLSGNGHKRRLKQPFSCSFCASLLVWLPIIPRLPPHHTTHNWSQLSVSHWKQLLFFTQ